MEFDRLVLADVGEEPDDVVNSLAADLIGSMKANPLFAESFKNAVCTTCQLPRNRTYETLCNSTLRQGFCRIQVHLLNAPPRERKSNYTRERIAASCNSTSPRSRSWLPCQKALPVCIENALICFPFFNNHFIT